MEAISFATLPRTGNQAPLLRRGSHTHWCTPEQLGVLLGWIRLMVPWLEVCPVCILSVREVCHALDTEVCF